ncbi:hypothetical protein A1Q2_02091 [Trichosporon asahii var. asahii CBS 8904]|uniref:Uncharacterized protein n=2 Tax=Trichosporon asahii var. asahii TaxID=189963 RepID=K1WRH4_TRIAC|nr:hypothetical protein A1Q1_04110 [Trichosporon asahii var. asahii CBS 2479]EJT47117.1 hypothetical protein A1Q1_04110 [Trichosporon asahii var. asahii CBS 2479]EKD03614.1 hypothetical protein A1Q2_02091 [Trichosporon asahii var. asahii CBS 8904]
MEKQLNSPLLIEQVGRSTTITPKQTYTQLSHFLAGLAPSPARTQLERLTDSLGVEVGAIAPSEGERREAERVEARNKARAEKREAKRRAEEEAAAEASQMLEAEIEAEAEAEVSDEEGEGGLGVGGFPGDETMDDRGDVEYGDVPEDDEDEPDNEEGA